jgi:PEP-CTERM motif
MRHHILTSLLTMTAVAIVAAPLHAADITFAPAQVVTSPADVHLPGTLDRAYSLGYAGNLNVNGIPFAPFAANLHGDTTTLDGTYDAYAGGGQTGDFGTLLQHGQFRNFLPAAINFNGLTPGAIYTVEVLASGLRARSDCCQAGAAYTNNFISSGNPFPGGAAVEWKNDDPTARSIVGTFTAAPDGRQTIDFNNVATVLGPDHIISAQIHAVGLSYTAVPEPSTIALLTLAACAVSQTRRRTR